MPKPRVKPVEMDQYVEFAHLDNLMQWGIDLQNNSLYLVDEINEISVEPLIKALHCMDRRHNKIKDKPIKLHICSPGGEMAQMFSLYDTIMLTSAPIVTIGMGEVASAALPILVSGTKRLVTENTFCMAHMPLVKQDGSIKELKSATEAAALWESRMWNILGRHTKKSKAQWQAMVNRQGEVWMDAHRMVEWGVVDDIVEITRDVEPFKGFYTKKK